MKLLSKWLLFLLALVLLSVAYRAWLQSGDRPRNPDESQYLAEVAYQARSQLSWDKVLAASANRPLHLLV
jgi:hypothetical protein